MMRMKLTRRKKTEWCHKIHTLVKNWRDWIQEKRGQEERKLIIWTREKQVYFERLEVPLLPESRFRWTSKGVGGSPKASRGEKMKRREGCTSKGAGAGRGETHKNMNKKSGWHLKQREKKAKVRDRNRAQADAQNTAREVCTKRCPNPKLKQSRMPKLNPRLKFKNQGWKFAHGSGIGWRHPHQKGSKGQRERRKGRETWKAYAMTTFWRRKCKTRKAQRQAAQELTLDHSWVDDSGHKKTASTPKNKESHWAPPTREVFTSRKFHHKSETWNKAGWLVTPFP